MALTRRALLRASAISAGGLLLARPLGALGQPLGAVDAAGTSRASRLFPGQRLVHADMHNHTIFSDADPGATAELAYETMARGGMDVAALTDHSALSWAPAGVPSEFPCPPDDVPTIGEGCRSLFGLSNEEWAVTAELAAAATVTREQALADPSLREVLGVRGFEWSSPTLGHMNVWFSAEYIDPLHTGGVSAANTAADFLHDGSADDPTGLAVLLEGVLRTSAEVVDTPGMLGFQRWLSLPPDTPGIGGGNDGIAGFNHPGREADRFGEFTFEPAIRDQVVSLELLNRREDYLFEQTDRGRTSPLIACLARGWRPGILGVSDEHAPEKRVDGDLGKGRAGMWVGELSAVGVREAMRQRRFYACRVQGFRLDAAADGVRMGQAFSHPGGPVLVQLDLASGAEHDGRELDVHVIGPPADGEILPAILAQRTVTLPTDVIELTADVDPERTPWFAVRISEPGGGGDDVGFGLDGRAAGTPFEPLGPAWAYASPWYVDASAPAAPASRRAPLTEPPPPADGGSGGGGAGGSGGGVPPAPGDPGQPTEQPSPTEPPPGPSDPVVTPVVTRRAGPGRVDTAVALSRATFVEGVDTVLLAAAGAFPDALAGSAAAAALRGPVLLVDADAIPDLVVAELERLRPRRIVVLGGPAVVSPAVEARARDLADVVERVAGDDRYGTAAAISARSFPVGAPTAWVASGEGFADALAAGPAAARTGGPLLLTAAAALPEATAAELRRLGPTRILVPGGAAAVTNAVLDALGEIAPTERVAGGDRFETAAAVALLAFPSAAAVVIASGEAFPDALAAGPVAAMAGGPVLPVRPDGIPMAIDAELRRLKPERITIAGGTAAVSEAVQRQLEAYDIR